MNPKRPVSMSDLERIENARQARDEAEANYRRIVLDVATRASHRETAAAARISPDTLTRWKRNQ